MKKTITYRIIGFCLYFLLMPALVLSAQGAIENIDAATSAALVEKHRHDPDFVILDIRTPPEYEAGHIAGARMLDFYAKTFVDDFKALDRDKTYLVYCRSGNRSGQLMQAIGDLGFKKIYNLDHGLKDWVRRGYPLVKP